ncbi:uncharacterized protein LOC123561515 [Mercenaria mercenaria]|uniref:uncharacterized protein LOC123561515 n=1 Tax=Mercenaria mercenaria TaxID=6596 RepID=UPI00234EEC18|nr:uncharacterized protein LOC123561515 [Mercenaria mercenaria]
MNRQQRIARLRERLAIARHRLNIAVAALVAEEEIEARQRRQRRWWVKPWIQRRPLYGQYETLMQELRLEHHGDFKAYLRMEPDMFQELCARVGPRIQMSQDGRPPLSSGIKLAITLRFLATGNSYRSLAFDFRVTHNTISLFVPSVCRAIVEEYEDEVFSTPSTPDE